MSRNTRKDQTGSKGSKRRIPHCVAVKVVVVKILNMRWLVLLLLFLWAAMSAWAVNPSYRISQYGHTAWRIQDGFLGSAPYAIAQTADGYLWIGMFGGGLVRFDGVHFVPWTPPPGKQLLSPLVYSLLAARDGSLWIGTALGLSHWTNQELVNYSSYADAGISSIIEDDDGTIWVTLVFQRTGKTYDRITDRTGPLCQVKGMAMRCYGKADGVPEESYDSLARDSAGNFWMGSDTSLTRWKPGSFETYYPSGLKSNAGQLGVSGLASRPDGSLWVGIDMAGPGLGLEQLVQGVWKPFIVPGLDSSSLEVIALFRDRQNALWVGTLNQGIYRIYGREVDHFGSSAGLSSDYVEAFFEDREGNLWVATSKGIDCFRDLQITTFSTHEGLTTPEVDSVQASRDGTVWIGGADALDILGQGRFSSVQTGKGLPGNQVTSLFEDHAGQRWVGVGNSLFLFEKRRFTRINRRDRSPTGMVFGITEDVDHNIWVLSLGPPRMLIRIYDRKAREELPTPQIPAASSIVADPRGGIWLGLLNGDLARYQRGRTETFRFEHTPDSRVIQVLVSSDGSVLGATAFGLIGWSNGKEQTLSARNGLPCDSVNGLVEDGTGALWLYMQCGLVEIARSDLQRWWAEPNLRLQPRVFDVFDGLQPGSPAHFENKAVRTPDGRLWFANATVLQMIDPAHLVRNLMPPAVHVQQVIADRKSYSLESDLRLPAHTRDVEIDYTALSFAVPQKVRFRYRLEGRDTDWQEPATRRQAFYTDLRPGPYRFHVIACNNDGVWNNDGATVDFNVAAAWYQTSWFRGSCGAVFVLLLWALYQLRLRQLARGFNMRLEERVGERARIARELHDTLLQSFHGLMFQFQAARNMLPRRPEEAIDVLDSAIGATEQAISEGRSAIQKLRSEQVDGGDLEQWLTNMGEELARSQTNGDSPMFRATVEGEQQTLSPLARTEICRITREILQNAFRHAQAQHIEAEIRYDDRLLRVRIRDDGTGIDPKILQAGGSAGHWGLRGVRERAQQIGSRLDFWSEAGAGTEVQLTVPAAVAYEKSRDKRRFTLFRKKGQY
jgi:signal transduction histidine kinase/ligand-binding sensor domain-containing protein